MGVDYATTLTGALLQVLASYRMQCFSHFHVLIPMPMHFIPIPIPFPSHGSSYSHYHGNPTGPMRPRSFPFPRTSLVARHSNLNTAVYEAIIRPPTLIIISHSRHYRHGRYALSAATIRPSVRPSVCLSMQYGKKTARFRPIRLWRNTNKINRKPTGQPGLMTTGSGRNGLDLEWSTSSVSP